MKDEMRTEEFLRIIKDEEMMLVEPLTGRVVIDYIKRSYVIYEGFIRDAGI